ncbi:MAG: hypothetical protein L6Q54_13995 [Leptospiraceae bacterium]|nr:hypothetical protein [Leptospiraceae bacterium]MCK6382347.1 hypothetical protein [Leptospiraceae bacterium]NUM40356.1 hypothetical protein [Leptospiraceae bacterium]
MLRILIRLVFLSVLIFFFFTCKEKEIATKNFKNTKINFNNLCDKIQECYESYYRTIPNDMQESLSVKNCKKEYKEDFEKKLSLYSKEDLFEYENCFTTMMKTPCKKFLIISMIDPVCTKIREKNKKNFSKNSKKLHRD